MGVSATYVSAISFTVATDLTAVFHSGRRVRAYCGVDGYEYGTILSSSYSDPDTTVLLTAASDDLTANLASVDVGVVGAAANSAMPEHGHDINLIINGCMRIAQRGTSFVAGANDDDTYVLDRWNLISDGNDIVDVTQQSSGGVDGNSKYIRLDVETVSKKFGIVQIIEAQNLYGVIGKEVSVSFDLKVSNATKLSDIRAAILSWDSTADTVTSDVVSAWAAEGSNPTWATNWTAENTPANLSVTTSWARYTINGINVDTASAANIALVIWQNNVATNDTLAVTLDITNVKVAPSPFASKMITRHIADELALCQRYFQESYEHGTDPGANTAVGLKFFLSNNHTSSTYSVYYTVDFPVEMRDTPTVVTYALSGNSGKIDLDSGEFTPVSVTESTTGIYVLGTDNVASTNRRLKLHYTADAEL